jgi:putative membrane protein
MAWLHYVALAVGAAGVWIRGRGFARRDLATIFYGDNLWGIAAILWIGTGLMRAFGGLEKGTAYYLAQPFFHAKMGLYLLLALLELWPMVTLIRWRVDRSRGREPDLAPVAMFARINTVEIVGVLVMPLLAAAMARGLRPG